MSGIVAAIAAFICTAFAVLVLMPVCERLGHVDAPGGRKTHKLETPLCGGIAIALGVVVVGLGVVPSSDIEGFVFGVFVLLVLGAMDDRRHVSSVLRLALQALAVGVGMCWLGDVYLLDLGPLLGTGPIELGVFSIPFTIFAAVGVINAVNMIDGIDGLAGGFATMLAGTFLALSVGRLAGQNMLLYLTLGSCLGFLVFNLRTPWQRSARIFLGDAGSLVLGFMLTWFAISHSQGSMRVIDPITAVWLFGLPLADTAYLMLSRLGHGQSPLRADRYHFHHLLQSLGLSPGWTLYAWLAVAACFMAFGVAAQWLGMSDAGRFVTFLVVLALYAIAVKATWWRVGS